MTEKQQQQRRTHQAHAGNDVTNKRIGSGRPTARSPWRATIDSFGGFLTIGVVAITVLIIGVLVIANSPSSTSTQTSIAQLLGEARTSGKAEHIKNPAQIEIVPGEPPTGGPHFVMPQRTGIYDEPIKDGHAIHSLEHGILWISYQPNLVDEKTVNALRNIAEEFSSDVILSPRPQNVMPIALASWGRLLPMRSLNEELAREFINTNRNRSPEPGVR